MTDVKEMRDMIDQDYVSYPGRHKLKRGQQILCWMALAIPYYFIHSYFDDMGWKLYIVSIFISIWMILMSVGIIELIFHVKEARYQLLEMKVAQARARQYP